MKKFILLIALILTAFMFSFNNQQVKADTFSDNTLIFAYYNDKAKYYDNLEGITEFSLNNDIIVYTLDGQTINILNKSTKQVSSLTRFGLTFNNIVNIELTKNFLFVQDNSTLTAYNLKTFVKQRIYIDVTKNTELPDYKSFSISEDNDKLVIACINDNTFVSYFFSPLNLNYLSKYTNSAIDNQTDLILNVVTTNNTAYIINNATNSQSSSLWKVDYSNANQFTKSLFPKPNIESLVVYNYQGTEYLLAINTTHVVYVLRTDLQYSNNNEDFDADQTRNGNTTDSRFVVNDLSSPNDIILYDNKIYISDIGTKCIQEFTFQLTNDHKGSIVGTDILLASDCGEIGRFNKHSNIEYLSNKLIISDTNNRRIQIINNGIVTNIDKDILTNLTQDNLNNLNTAIILNNTLYFATYNNTLLKQNFYSYSLTTNILNTITHNIEKVLDMTINGNYIYILGTNGIFEVNTNTTNNVCKMLTSTIFTSGKITNLSNNKLIISTNNNIHLYNILGQHITTATIDQNITDIVSDNNFCYTLIAENNSIRKYSIIDNTINLLTALTYDFYSSDYSSITIDKSNGILYLFDNNCCRIDKIINPAFNYKNISGIFQVNNKNVCIYDRPYFLNGIDEPVILQKLKVNNRITIYSTASINYGNIEYYIIDLDDGDYGYINKNDLTYLSEVVNYEIIHPNATIRTFDNSLSIPVYIDADINSLVIAQADIGTRIKIIDYNESTDFTYIKFYDKDQNLIEGYIKTNNINTDNITKSQSTALILIAVSIILIITIAVVVKIIYKKNNKKSSY